MVNKVFRHLTKMFFALFIIMLLALTINAASESASELEYSFDEASQTYSVVGIGTYEGAELKIPDEYNGYPVTSIGASAFSNCTSLTSVEIPNSVTSIGYSAFSNCTSLKTAIVPSSVTSIIAVSFPISTILLVEENSYAYTFAIENDLLYHIYEGTNMPETYDVNNIKYYIQNGNAVALSVLDTTVTEVTIPSNVNGYPVVELRETFKNCKYLTSVTLPNSLTTIGKNAFYYCSKLTSIEIPNSVTSIRSSAFSNCTSLKTAIVPNSVTSIIADSFSTSTILLVEENSYAYAFAIDNNLLYHIYDGTNMPEVYDVNNIRYYIKNGNAVALSALDTTVTEVTIPSSIHGYPVVELRETFKNCKSLTSVTLSNSLTTIGKNAFYYCSKLTNIEIPNSVTSIGNSAFYNCTDLDSLTIPDSVTSIGEYAFHHCINLKSVTLGNGIKTIESYTFYFCTQLESLDLGESVETIEEYAFYNCIDLDSLTIPDSVTTVGAAAFKFCDNIIKLVIGENVTSLDETAFEGCYKIVEVYNLCGINVVNEASGDSSAEEYLIDSAMVVNTDSDAKSILTWLENGYVFAYFEGVYYLVSQTGNEESLTLPDYINGNTYEVNRFAFHNRVDLEQIKFGEGITSIGNGAFNFCGVASVTLNEGITTIGKMAFNDCHILKTINLPNSLTSLGIAAFQKCYSLTSITIPKNITALPQNVFYGCALLQNVTLPQSLESIADAAFYECASIVSITLPRALTSIGRLSFGYCDVLKMVYIPKNVGTISDYAFYQCPKLNIYCEADTAQENWSQNWNYNGYTVNWGVSLDLKNAFVFKGYSTNGTQISAGYTIDYNTVEAYELFNNVKVDFGIVFASYELLGGELPLDGAANPVALEKGKVIKMSLSDNTYTSYDFILMDLTADYYDHKFVIAGYTYDGAEIAYVQDTESESIVGKSYNEILDLIEEDTSNEGNEGICCPAL